ncbi:MAG TPA: AIR synthase family protein [Candidatus Anaerotignum merdipullorum]|nr:AIR synthase family protein [Candidatus Anaerotignum merdipullorum]
MFEIGKIPPQILERMVLHPVTHSRVHRADIVVRPKTGEDCSAIDPAGELCVFSTDPITGATKDAGYLAVHVNCNDVFSAGAEPVGILMTVLLPPSAQEETLQELMQGTLEAAAELGIEVLGGHTEVTAVVNQPVISATIVGKTKDRHLVCTGGAQVGQDVIMTKWAGLEGTSIIAREYEAQLQERIPAEWITEAKDMKGFLSVGTESRIAMEHGATAMHDATEGGILGAVWEMAECSQKGVTVYADRILVKESTKAICREAGIAPLQLISSGTMIIAAFQGEELVEKLRLAGVESAVIGKITHAGRWIVEEGRQRELEQPQSDALYQVRF